MMKSGETMGFAPDIPWLEKLYSDDLQARKIEHLTVMQTALGISREDKAARLKLVRQNFECFGAPHLALLYGISLGFELPGLPASRIGQGRADSREFTRYHR